LAGPVVVAAVILDPLRPIQGLADSKVLDAARREALAPLIQLQSLAWSIIVVEVDEIDRIALSTEFNGIKLLDGSASTVTFQVGINTAVGIDSLNVALTPALSTTLGLNSVDVGSGGSTSFAITQIDSAINQVSQLRGRFGSLQNRLQSTIANLGVTGESLSAAESRIRDVDVAFETAELTRNNILQQASISILSQANAQPQSALQLLQG
jgi:flagellin